MIRQWKMNKTGAQGREGEHTHQKTAQLGYTIQYSLDTAIYFNPTQCAQYSWHGVQDLTSHRLCSSLLTSKPATHPHKPPVPNHPSIRHPHTANPACSAPPHPTHTPVPSSLPPLHRLYTQQPTAHVAPPEGRGMLLRAHRSVHRHTHRPQSTQKHTTQRAHDQHAWERDRKLTARPA